MNHTLSGKTSSTTMDNCFLTKHHSPFAFVQQFPQSCTELISPFRALISTLLMAVLARRGKWNNEGFLRAHVDSADNDSRVKFTWPGAWIRRGQSGFI